MSDLFLEFLEGLTEEEYEEYKQRQYPTPE